MSTMLIMLMVLVQTSALALVSRKRLEEQLPIAVTCTIMTLYAFGAVGKLAWGIYAVGAGTLGAAIFLLYRLPKVWKEALRLLITPATAVLMLIFVWLFICFRRHTAYVWDDFSHWMLAVKNMVYLDAIPSFEQQAAISYTSYPPGATLFGYFWTKLSGGFNEGDPQRAMNLLILSFLLPMMRTQDWRGWLKSLCMAASLFVLPLVYNQAGYSCIYVDTLMGCVMLHAIGTWFASRHDAHDCISIGCALVLLPLLKTSGLFFAVLCLAIMGVDWLLSQYTLYDEREAIRRRVCSGASIDAFMAGASQNLSRCGGVEPLVFLTGQSFGDS